MRQKKEFKPATDCSTEQAIMEAAGREFVTKGFDGAKTTEIAAAAGVTHAMLHYYFRSKENLFNTIFEKTLCSMLSVVFDIMEQGDMPLTERIRNFVGVHFDYMVANPRLPQFIINELINKPERIQMLGERMTARAMNLLQQLEDEIEENIKKGVIYPITAIDLLLNIVSMNVFIFLALPIADNMDKKMIGATSDLLAVRRKESIDCIMRRLVINYKE